MHTCVYIYILHIHSHTSKANKNNQSSSENRKEKSISTCYKVENMVPENEQVATKQIATPRLHLTAGHFPPPSLPAGEPSSPSSAKGEQLLLSCQRMRPWGSSRHPLGSLQLFRSSSQSGERRQEGADLLHTWGCKTWSEVDTRELYQSECAALPDFASDFLE